MKSAVLAAVLALVVLSSSPAAVPNSQEVRSLPIVTGNFSVTWIQHSPVGAFPDPNFSGEGVPPPENWAGHHEAGLSAYEDYVAWGAVEREPGKWDWSRQIEVSAKQRAGGLEYDPYLWIHNPPMWMRSRDAGMGGRGDAANRKSEIIPNDPDAPDHYTLLRCLEHGEPTYTLSIFDPATVKWFERFYREMRRAIGDRIGRTYVGLIGPYGEGNYPLPMFDWLKIGHCHEGYWCGDDYARKAFKEAFKKRYRTLERLNDAWGTYFADWEQVDFPPEIKAGHILKAEERTDPKARRRWVDFIEWYHQAIIDFSADVTKAALKYFPVEQLKMKPGGSAGGVNPIAWGTYCPGYAKAHGSPGAGLGAERADPTPGPSPKRRGETAHLPPYRGEDGRGVDPLSYPFPKGTCDTPAASSRLRLQPADCHGRPFGDRWYGTAYRFYGIPLTTEPAGGLSERDFRRRVFMDACNGATEMFSYEWGKHKDDGLKWIHLYSGVPSITDVAVYCPTTWYRMNGDIWPAIRSADALRDITDFEVADELLIQDDYLRKAKIRVLIWLQGSVVERSVLEKVVEWVESGGIVVARAAHPPTDVEGRDDLGLKLFPNGDAAAIHLGRGLVLRAPDADFRDLVRAVVSRREGEAPAEPRQGIPAGFGSGGPSPSQGGPDGVWTALFPDRLLLYNNGDKPADVKRSWNGREIEVRLEAGELAEVNGR